MTLNKISIAQAIPLIFIITINRLSVNIPQSILIPYGSSSILNMIYICIIAIIFTLFIVKLFQKFPNCDIVDVSEFLGGKVLRNIVGLVIVTQIVLVSSNLLRDFVDMLHIIYYSDTPIIFILAFFVIVGIISNTLGGDSIIKTNVIISSLMIVSLLVSFISVIPNITIQRALPLLGYGSYKTFVSGISNIFAFNGLSILYLVPSMMDNHQNYKKASIIATIISCILLVLATASSLLSFSFSTVIEKVSPLYMLLSNNEFGKYLQHPESIFVFTWILSFMSYINIGCMLSSQILKKLTSVNNSKPFAWLYCAALFLAAILPKSLMQTRDIGTFLSKYISIPIVFLIFPFILLIANLKHKTNKNNNYDT